MDQCTHEVRAEYWKGIIKACGQRPAGQSARTRWMKMESANKAIIIGSRNSSKRLMKKCRKSEALLLKSPIALRQRKTGR